MAVMMTPRETWTDQRLDDLNKKVDEGFARVDSDVRELRGEVKGLRVEMNGRFDGLRDEMGGQVNGLRHEMNERFDRMQHTLIGGAAVIVAALIGVIATQL